ncbi:hypothetical protein BO94DRAFT_590587 [Aspergillus sclerotioniger CBS 115572]|uniref:Zn(2)-C6 fungal-type domain-containing protein n=1 Tax=Aspergillus sclerotioniger CBS 115572 TaxID=1450535 RepID=A0A317V7I2_9EURO|nr:hypothetical protein BO94DRAFT_590587 [Aspergillus sclerotioniger CBS 115572]PWY69008.1 hypothetical protein BO94DRAFT_590587 [Aspergillus sclerotioniger CBS 115572]
MSSHPKPRRSQSPQHSPRESKRRKRKTLSCYDCRRRKLKCDRELPACTRCRNAGQAHSCSYDEPADVLRHPSPTSTCYTPVNQEAVGQVARLPAARASGLASSSLEATPNAGTWQLLGATSSATGTNEQRPAIRSGVEKIVQVVPRNEQGGAGETEVTIFRGQNFMTQYYGSSNPISLISHFQELRTFMKETIMQRTSLPTLQRELKALQAKWKTARTELVPKSEWELFGLLPDQATIDEHVRVYFETFESLYRILHYPSFAKEYETFREDWRTAKPAFVVLLLLIMASVSCISDDGQTQYIGESSMGRERAALWIEASEWWLSCQSQKHVYLAIWQIRCLLVLAKQVNAVKKKQAWTGAGTLVRTAMSAGFHRDPKMLGERVSAFDQEMRQRLWATMLELELQASTERGMPSSMTGITSDSSTPLNIDDEELLVEGVLLPESKPWGKYTKCSFLHISAATFSLRTSINSKVNDIGSRWTYDDVMDEEEKITNELRRLPKWDDHGSSEMARTLLEIQLRHCLIMFHAPFARQTDSNPRHTLSKMVCFNAACEIIERHYQLSKSGNHALLLLRVDHFRAALMICHNLYISATIQNNLLGSNSNTLLQYVNSALDLLSQRITRLGTGYTHYWYISAAYTFLQLVLSPTDQSGRKEEAIERVVRQYHRILAHQEDLHKAKEVLFPLRLDQMAAPDDWGQTATDMANASFIDPNISQDGFENPELSLGEFFFGNPSAWTFDNLWSLE